MAGWDTRQECLDDISDSYATAHTFRGQAATHVGIAQTNIGSITDEYARGVCWQLSYALDDINDSILSLEVRRTAYEPDWGIPYFLTHYQSGPGVDPYDLTWEKIVAVWAKANKLGRLWTILSIDFMRKEVWDEPVTTFALKSGAPAG